MELKFVKLLFSSQSCKPSFNDIYKKLLLSKLQLEKIIKIELLKDVFDLIMQINELRILICHKLQFVALPPSQKEKSFLLLARLCVSSQS